MSSDKREFKNFKSFPGKINDETFNYEFPELFIYSDKGKLRKWVIIIRIIKTESKKPELTKKQNWNLLEEDQVPIKIEYLEDDAKISEGLIAQVWTETGVLDMKISRNAPTYTEIKNKGKKNERNVFHQALVLARGKYLKKIQEGFFEKKHLKPLEKIKVKDKKYFPMLAEHYTDHKNKVKYPVFIQPKLDGLRCLAYLDKFNNATYEDVILYTREKKEYPFNSSNNNIRKALLNVLIKFYNEEKNESIFLDGEIYKHGLSLQTLNSTSRTSIDTDSKEEYHIYDIFYPYYTNETFEKRNNLVLNIFNTLEQNNKKFIKYVPTDLVYNEQHNDELFRNYKKLGYEGIIIRKIDGKYMKSATKKSSQLRSINLLKRKEVYSNEFEVVDFTDGKKGKEVGAIIWIVKTKDNKTFRAVPNISYSERYKLFKECNKQNKKIFINKYLNKLLTVEYRSYSADNIPQHAKAIAFRDFF